MANGGARTRVRKAAAANEADGVTGKSRKTARVTAEATAKAKRDVKADAEVAAKSKSAANRKRKGKANATVSPVAVATSKGAAVATSISVDDTTLDAAPVADGEAVTEKVARVGPKVVRRANGTFARASADSDAEKADAKPKALVQRVYNTIDLELGKLEKQKGVASQDRERASRALSQHVNSLEKAIEMQRDLVRRAAKRVSAKDKEALAHAEHLRRDIADRLERLNRQRKSSRSTPRAE